jgi:hypothetical protein
MTQPTHTSGPVIARPQPESKVGRITITGATSPVAIAEIVPTTMKGYDATAEANGRLIKAAYNAFDSAAKKLGCNAVELAERMQNGEIADLVETLQLFEQSRTAFEHANDTESERLYANAADRNRAILAKVKGGAS